MSKAGVDDDNGRETTRTKRRKTINGTTTCSSRWVNLPEDILLDISNRVDSRRPSDFPCRLRSVCTSWRSALSRPPLVRQLKFPISVPYLGFITSQNETSKPIYSVRENKFYLRTPLAHRYTRASSQGWVVRVDEAKPRTWRLLQPDDDERRLFTCTPPIRAEINLLDYRIQGPCRSYTLVEELIYRRWTRSHKVVVSLSPTDDADVTVIMAVMYHAGHLNFWRTGETEWRTWSKMNFIDEIASYNGKFYALDSNNGNTYVIDPLSIAKTKQFDNDMTNNYVIVTAPSELSKCRGSHYLLGTPRKLVECEGRLYYVVHDSISSAADSDCSVSMFVLNLQHSRWDRVMDIKDNVLFLLSDASFAIKAHELGRHSRGGWISYVSKFGVGRCTTYYCKGLQYPLYDRDFYKCELHEPEEGDPPNKQRLGKVTRFGDSSDKLCAEIFFPPPPGIKWRRCRARSMIFSMRYSPRPDKDG